MKESKLEIKAKNFKQTLSKRVNDYFFKLTAYIIDGIPMDKNVSADNCVVYGRFPNPRVCYKGELNLYSHRYKL